MSTQWGPNDWRERGFASFDEYEQWLDDQAQAAALERWRERRTRGERGCFSLLFASLPAIAIWAVVIVLWLQPWLLCVAVGTDRGIQPADSRPRCTGAMDVAQATTGEIYP